MLAGISGALLSGRFLETRLRALVQPGDARSAARFPADLGRWWARVAATCGPAASPRGLLDTAFRPLASLLGLQVARSSMVSDAVWRCALRHADSWVPALVTTWGHPLDRGWRDASRLGLASHARWCVLYNGTHLRVLDVGPATSRRHLDFDLEVLADHQRSAHAAWLILGSACLPQRGVTGAADVLSEVVAVADREGVDLCAGLQRGVREALEHLTSGVLGAATGRRTADRELAAAYDDATTAVYRMLFLLFAEARGLVPAWHPVYARSYTFDALRADAEGTGDAVGLWEAFQAMSRLAHQGCEAGDLHVTAFNGRLFAPHRAPMLDTRQVPDAAMRAAVRALSSASTPRGRERVCYRDLGVEELGAVYETLLEYEPRSAPDGRGPGPVVLVQTGPERRKTTGTFYTPEPITRYLVRHALEPLTAAASSEAVLALRVVDPAMGSGAFLVAACRQLAHAYETALLREGRCLPSDVSNAERAGFRRLVARRCLFGADANPMAVHLARLSLWLTTLAADRPLSFLDHHLVIGDSLIGVTATQAAQRPPCRRPARESDGRQLPLFALDDLHASVRSALPIRRGLEQDAESSAEDVRRKETMLDRLTSAGELRRWRAVCDLWCAVFLGPQRMPPPLFAALVDHIVRRAPVLQPATAERSLEPARRLAESRRFLHWPLAFPEVFCDEAGREHPDGGFDAVVGNPPWEVLRADAGRPSGADRAATRFTRQSGLYHAQSGGHPNLYQVFLERAVQLVRPGGRIALVLPHGLASDQGAARLRHLLLHRCTTDRLVGFENRSGVFPIHRSVRFLLVTATRGGRTVDLPCRFGLQDPAALDGLSEAERDRPGEAFPVRLTPEVLARLSGPDLAIPDIRSPIDLQLAERLAATIPRLTSESGWGARFGRELNASDDRGHFRSAAAGLPVIEGKHLSPFTVHRDRVVSWIAVADAKRLLPHQPYLRERLAFRDVASATNRTTLIAALVPAGCVTTHSVFCLRTRLDKADQLLLCALLNSYVANYLVRMRVSSHVTLAIVDTLPVPRIDPHEGLGDALVALARTLASGVSDSEAEAQVQALAAEAYGITAPELDHVLSTFPLVPERDRAAAAACFRRGCRR